MRTSRNLCSTNQKIKDISTIIANDSLFASKKAYSNGNNKIIISYSKSTFNKSNNNNKKLKQESQKPSQYLTPHTVQKMLYRFLIEKQMPKEKLTELLGISVKELNQVNYQPITSRLMRKINLPLIKLYCATHWPELNKYQKNNPV